MTKKLYFNDMYGKEFDGRIEYIEGNKIILDKTLFYPTSGGQPNDTGIIKNGDKLYNVIDVYKEGENIIHVLDNSDGLAVNDQIHGKINWERRYIHMRYHTAVHIIDGVVDNNYDGQGFLTGGQIYDNKARVDFSFDAIDKQLIENIIENANKIVTKGLSVFQREMARDEALKIPGLARTGPGMELIQKLDQVRIIEIDNFDFQADGGTHVANTREVGKIVIQKVENKGKGHKRLAFSLD